MSVRAVGYSRYSTDLQNEKSIEDQEALIRRYAKQQGFEIVKLYSDAAKSGASIRGRDGLQELMHDALDGKFDVVIVEGVDRLSRDMEDSAGLFKRLQFLQIGLHSTQEGMVTPAVLGIRATFAQMWREDNVYKTRRGMSGLIASGKSAGGRAYGYRPDPAKKGVLVIVPEEAAIVRRVFEDFLAGRSPRAIATELQKEGVPPPRGDHWAPSAIYGWAARSTGILRNELYVGRIVWNKVRMLKDPDTGKRTSRPNPVSEWQVKEVPELRIVPQELWDKVQEVIKPSTPKPIGKRPQRMLSGLLKCGACGSGMSISGKDSTGRYRIGCTRHHDSRSCPDPHSFYLDKVEQTVVELLRKELMHPDLLVTAINTYNEARIEFAAQANKRRAALERTVDKLEHQVSRLLKLLMNEVGDDEHMAAEYKARRAELIAAKEELAKEPAPVNSVSLHPAALKAYSDALNRVHDSLNLTLEKGVANIAPHLRSLIHSVTVRPGKAPGEVDVLVQGRLRKLLEDQDMNIVMGSVVAGAGFEPAAFRL